MKFPFEKQNVELVQYSEVYLTQEKQGIHFLEAVKKSERAKLTSPGKQVQSNACHVNQQKYTRQLQRLKAGTMAQHNNKIDKKKEAHRAEYASKGRLTR